MMTMMNLKEVKWIVNNEMNVTEVGFGEIPCRVRPPKDINFSHSFLTPF